MKALFDSNIVIDFLNGIKAAREEFDLYEGRAISMITWMEVMSGVPPEMEAVTRQFLARFELVSIDAEVAERAVRLRASKSLKLPDAIVLASAIVRGLILVTRDTKAFGTNTPAVRIPYSVK